MSAGEDGSSPWILAWNLETSNGLHRDKVFALLKGLLVVAVAAGARDLQTFPQRI